MSHDHLTPIGTAVRRWLERLSLAPIEPSSTYADGSKRWQRGAWSLYVSPPLDGRRTVILSGPPTEVARYRSGGSYAVVAGRRIV